MGQFWPTPKWKLEQPPSMVKIDEDTVQKTSTLRLDEARLIIEKLQRELPHGDSFHSKFQKVVKKYKEFCKQFSAIARHGKNQSRSGDFRNTEGSKKIGPFMQQVESKRECNDNGVFDCIKEKPQSSIILALLVENGMEMTNRVGLQRVYKSFYSKLYTKKIRHS